MRSATTLPLWMKPNAGSPEIIDGQTVYSTSAQDFAHHVPLLIEAGANFIGGCCGTDKDFIIQTGNALKNIYRVLLQATSGHEG
jgi:5-methyltetrahydrofolate--homocysteine methyltransferase